MSKIELNADLIKKYHQELVFNYSEYPTKNNWDYKFNDQEYKNSLVDWLGYVTLLSTFSSEVEADFS